MYTVKSSKSLVCSVSYRTPVVLRMYTVKSSKSLVCSASYRTPVVLLMYTVKSSKSFVCSASYRTPVVLLMYKVKSSKSLGWHCCKLLFYYSIIINEDCIVYYICGCWYYFLIGDLAFIHFYAEMGRYCLISDQHKTIRCTLYKYLGNNQIQYFFLLLQNSPFYI